MTNDRAYEESVDNNSGAKALAASQWERPQQQSDIGRSSATNRIELPAPDADEQADAAIQQGLKNCGDLYKSCLTPAGKQGPENPQGPGGSGAKLSDVADGPGGTGAQLAEVTNGAGGTGAEHPDVANGAGSLGTEHDVPNGAGGLGTERDVPTGSGGPGTQYSDAPSGTRATDGQKPDTANGAGGAGEQNPEVTGTGGPGEQPDGPKSTDGLGKELPAANGSGKEFPADRKNATPAIGPA